jgi:hypothetical protein
MTIKLEISTENHQKISEALTQIDHVVMDEKAAGDFYSKSGKSKNSDETEIEFEVSGPDEVTMHVTANPRKLSAVHIKAQAMAVVNGILAKG